MKGRQRKRGATIVEAAVTSLLLFALLFAILGFGRAFNIYQVVTDAAREGARYAVAPDAHAATPYALPSAGAVADKVCGYLQSANIRFASGSCGLATGPGGPTCASGGAMPPGVTAGVYVLQGCTQVINGVQTYYTEVDVKVPYRLLGLPFTVSLTTRAVMCNEATGQAYGN
ncbi:MAG TPA: TadE/TadG family type IV pilus assembly protein [Terriglobales bacterium]|nr:TadE/TadG family type IV pilus assembly protein [Terriglobales bacterium]